MADDQLAKDIGAVARLDGSFRLRSGEQSAEYFDKYQFESDPALLRRVAQRMLALLPPETDILAGLELGGVPIATAMALESGRPVVFVRKQAKEYGTCRAVEGADIRGRRVVLIEDVITTGGAIGEAAAQVSAVGGRVIAVVCAIWRANGRPAIASLPQIPVYSALRRTDFQRNRTAR